MSRILIPLALAASAALALPAAAEVVEKSDSGFVVRLAADVKATPEASWGALLAPAKWWNKAHTWSADSDNLYLDAQAGGCFCEKIPSKAETVGARLGSSEHMRVVLAVPGSVLRMRGSLGPLQSEAMTGTLTITLKAQDGGTRILWEYVVGGYSRYKVDEISAAVDKVLAEQLDGLAERLVPVSANKPDVKSKAPAKKAAKADLKPTDNAKAADSAKAPESAKSDDKVAAPKDKPKAEAVAKP